MEGSLSSVEDRLLEALVKDALNDEIIGTDNALVKQDAHSLALPRSDYNNTGEIVIGKMLAHPVSFVVALQVQSANRYANKQPVHSPTSTMTDPGLSYDNNPFQTMLHKIGEIRANTQVPEFDMDTVSMLVAPCPDSAPKSPIRQHPMFTHSLNTYQSPFPETRQPPLVQQPPLAAEYVLLRDFIGALPMDAPTPFKGPIFVQSPEQKRAWVERPVTRKEYDDEGRFVKLPVEMALVYDEPPKHRAHCVLCSSTSFSREEETVSALFTIWTRKYPAGWMGVHEVDGELVNYNEPRPNNWLYSAAAVLDIEKVETSVECTVSIKSGRSSGANHEMEPTWEDVVHALKGEMSNRIHRRPPVQLPPIPQQRSSMQTYSQPATRPQAPVQSPSIPRQQSSMQTYSQPTWNPQAPVQPPPAQQQWSSTQSYSQPPPVQQQRYLTQSYSQPQWQPQPSVQPAPGPQQQSSTQTYFQPQLPLQAPAQSSPVPQQRSSIQTYSQPQWQPQPLTQLLPPVKTSQQAVSPQIASHTAELSKDSPPAVPQTSRMTENQQNSQPAQPQPPLESSVKPCKDPNCRFCLMKTPASVPRSQEKPKVGGQPGSQSPPVPPESDDLLQGLSTIMNNVIRVVETVGLGDTNVPPQDRINVQQTPQGNAVPAAILEKSSAEGPQLPEKPKPARKRAPAKKKQTTTTQNIPEIPGPTQQAAVAQTPSPPAKRGRKRKNSTITPSTTKQNSASKDPSTKTTAADTATAETTPTKPPPKKRVRKSTKATPPSTLKNEHGKEDRSSGNMQDSLPKPPAQFNSSPYSPATGLEAQQSQFNEFNRDQSQQMGQNQFTQGQGVTANLSGRPQMPTSAGNNQPVPGSFYPPATSPVVHPYVQEIWGRIMRIDSEINYHLHNCPQANQNPEAWQGIQSRIQQLGREREIWSSRIPSNPYVTYSPSWNGGWQSNNDSQSITGMLGMQPSNGPVQANNQTFALQQPNNGRLQHSNQMLSAQQNNNFNQGNPQTPMLYGYSASGPSSAEHFDGMTFGSSYQPAMSGTFPGNEGTTNYPAPSPLQLALAEYSQEDVLRARSSVENTLARPSGPPANEDQSPPAS